MIHEIRPSKKRRRDDLVGSNSNYCNVCKRMTSTWDGLQALTSSTGYQHSSKRTVEDEAFRGCPLCIMILKSSRTSWRSCDRLSFIARPLNGNYETMNTSNEPLLGCVPFIETLIGRSPDDKLKVNLIAFTTAG